MSACPICATVATSKRESTPYWSCTGCGLLFQDPLPPKAWHGPHETHLAEPMPDGEKAINAQLADHLFREVMHGSRGKTLDIGASYAWLAHSLAQLGCEAHAWDGSDELERFRADYPDVACRYVDFEAMNAPNYRGLALITFVHAFEHVYNPVGAFYKLRRMIADDGAVFIRMPDSGVAGIERDFTDGHYQIHPFVHCIASIAELCARTRAFIIESAAELRPGQRDVTLSPIA